MATATILFLEEEPKLIEAVGRAWQEIGFNVEVAADFNKALQHVQQDNVVLIVLNVELSQENGYALFKKIKKEKATAAIPCIITSAAATAAEDFKKHRSLQTPAAAYLAKPYKLFDMFDLMSTIIDFPEAVAIKPLPVVPSAPAAATAASSGDWQARENDLNEKHKKAQNTLRDFYREKLEKMQAELDGMQTAQLQLEEFRSTIDHLQQEVQAALDAKTKAEQMLDKERSLRKRVSDALKDHSSE